MKLLTKTALLLTIFVQLCICNVVSAQYLTKISADGQAAQDSKNIQPIDRLIVFGDSLSDTGNLYKKFLESFPMSPPYFEGHFSNGPVWVDYINKKYNIPAEAMYNYAYGGARAVQALLPIPGLESQVDKYIEISNQQANPDGLYIIWIGANDIVFDKQAGETPDVTKMQQTIIAQIEKLAQIGAKKFLILKLPNLGFSPEAFKIDKKNENTEYSQKLQKLSVDFNAQLTDSLKALIAKYPDVTLLSFDTYTYIEDTIKNAKDFGILNTQERCNPNWYATPIKDVCSNPQEYLFWDAVHPTTRSHEILADVMLKDMNGAGYTFKTEWSLTDEEKNIAKQHQEAIESLLEGNITDTIKKAIFDIFR